MSKLLKKFFSGVLLFYGLLFTVHFCCCVLELDIEGINTGAIVACVSATLSALCFTALYIILTEKN